MLVALAAANATFYAPRVSYVYTPGLSAPAIPQAIPVGLPRAQFYAAAPRLAPIIQSVPYLEAAPRVAIAPQPLAIAPQQVAVEVPNGA